MSAEQAAGRLASLLPRFDMQTLQPVPRFAMHRAKSYLGTIDEHTFRLQGPLRSFRSSAASASVVVGTIHPAPQGSLIHVTAHNHAAMFAAGLAVFTGLLLAIVVAILPEVRGLMKLAAPLGILLGFILLGGLLYLIGSSNTKHHFSQLVTCLEAVFAARCQQWHLDAAEMIPVPKPKPWTPQQQKNIATALVIGFALFGLLVIGVGLKGLLTGELHTRSGKGTHRTEVAFYGDQARIMSLAFLSLGAGLLLAAGLAPAAVRSHGNAQARMTLLRMAAVALTVLLFSGGMIGLLYSFAVR
jgi:hypothetical protein